MQKDNINKPFKGLNTDNLYEETQEGFLKFALNTYNRKDGNIANENSNESCVEFPLGYIPIGSEYIGDGETVIFLVNPTENISEIGIFNKNCTYITHVNDFNSPSKLNFKLQNQIEARYRLRRGCEKTIYWVAKDSKPMYYNFNKPDNFKENGFWVAEKFYLQKQYSKIPEYTSIEVLDFGGEILPGSINFDICYVDESLNATEFINSSPCIRIYNDSINKEYLNISGSINSLEEHLNFKKTNKSIKVVFSNLDFNYPYYKVAIILSDTGTGQINKVLYSDLIPTDQNQFIYTGRNATSIGVEEELSQTSDIIESAESIEQIDNFLVLGNLKGKDINFCELQKYASQITADCVTQEIALNKQNIVDGQKVFSNYSSKNPTKEFYGTGFMPGEIYCFGIVYIFEDNTLSPVFHIPGKNNIIDPGTVFSPEYDIDNNLITYPMSSDNNIDITYNDNDVCSKSFWGSDSEGYELTGNKVRHHRFPLRSEINKNLVTEEPLTAQNISLYQLRLNISGLLKVPYPCPGNNNNCGTDNLPSFEVRITYKVNGQTYFFVRTINPSVYRNNIITEYNIDLTQSSSYHSTNVFTDIEISITDPFGNYQPSTAVILNTNFSVTTDDIYFNNNANYFIEVIEYTSTTQNKNYYTEMLGIKFSNIKLPNSADLNGHNIIGYYIVRAERTEFDKTILDSGVITPCVTDTKYVSHGLLQPKTTNISNQIYSLIHPEHKFYNKEYVNYDKLLHEGNFDNIERKYGLINFDDVYNGTSYNEKFHKDSNDDGATVDGSATSKGYDGWSLNIITRDNILRYKRRLKKIIPSSNMKDRFYLNALESKITNNDSSHIYNVAADNKVGIIEFEDNPFTSSDNLPYVVLYKENKNVYSDFRTRTYYKQNTNPIYFDTSIKETKLFTGDSYVTSMRYENTLFWDNRVSKRVGQTGWFTIALGVGLALIGAALTLTGIGAPVGAVIIGAGIVVLGGAALIISSGIKQELYNSVYNEEYEKGLKQTVLDRWVNSTFNYKFDFTEFSPNFYGSGNRGKDGFSDDSLQWISDCLTNLWFETSVNTELRNHFVNDVTPTFLNSPNKTEQGNNSDIATWKLSGTEYIDSNSTRKPISSLEKHIARKLLIFDPARDDNRYYLGVPLGEYYNLNLDYTRFNKEKKYYPLAIEYDCCSSCNEEFPHRWKWSQQSFQEELSDNYRVFLPNNYRDLDGESGKIINIFSIGNNLYIHTTEGLWQTTRNYQERITDQVVSFIGTGSLFEIPPQKIIDNENGTSSGTQHKWSSLKTKTGYYFISENQKTIYRFNGTNVEPISDINMYNWFFKNIPFLDNQKYFDISGTIYPYSDNPSHTIGNGFISTYDIKNERIIFTKKDFEFINLTEDCVVCFDEQNNTPILISPYQGTITNYVDNGWYFEGIKDCELLFSKNVINTQTTDRLVSDFIAKDVDYIILTLTNESIFISNFNVAASFEDLYNIPLITPSSYFGSYLPNTPNNYISWGGDNTAIGIANKESIFINVKQMRDDNILNGGFKLYLGLYWDITSNIDTLLYEGGDVSLKVETFSGGNIILTGNEFNNVGGTLVDSIYLGTFFILKPKTNNPNNNQKIGDFRYYETPSKKTISFPDITTSYSLSEEYVESIVTYPTSTLDRVFETYEGEPTNILGNNKSWTISFSLWLNNWSSYHSYLPSFYMYNFDNFYSWLPQVDKNYFWRHNVQNSYQTFYSVLYPHIVEFVSVSTPIITRIWNHLRLITESKKIDLDLQQEYEIVNTTFNKMILYNSKQCSGEVFLIPKENVGDNRYYYNHQTLNTGNYIIIDSEEGDWLINDFRDIRINYNTPIWNSNLNSLQNVYFIDKVLNTTSLDVNKNWTQLESFRDKYLVIRMIFDTFADVQLITKFSIENEQQSLN